MNRDPDELRFTLMAFSKSIWENKLIKLFKNNNQLKLLNLLLPIIKIN